MGFFSFLFHRGVEYPPASFVITDKELFSRGWNEEELRQILDDFQDLYRDRLPQDFSAEIRAGHAWDRRVTFPADIDPLLFCFLVNYVQYPRDFDLDSRTILVVGEGTIGSELLPSDRSLIGKRIMIYVPADDVEYDEVYGFVEGQSYKLPFSKDHWVPASEPRLPAGAEQLLGRDPQF